MTERLFGMEIEYGFAVRCREGVQLSSRRNWVAQFMSIASERLPHLTSLDGGGIFLENGARFYMDCSHPEMTTPECTNPWDVVRYMLAGEHIMISIAEEMKRREPKLEDILLFKTNIDYSGSGNTWGCHTSFMHRSDPAKFPGHIISHLVSRIIYSGAGGLVPDNGRLQFTLSPRVAFLQREVSECSTGQRGIFHTKDETLAGEGCHRLHIICGESLCSETALWLNMGATALCVAMIDAGLRPGDTVRLKNPLDAMRRFSMDPTCSIKAQTVEGRLLTAVQIQRHYLEMAEAHVDAPFMPPWARQVCAQWRSLLARLENNAPGSVASTLDWAMKFSLFLDRAQKHGLDLEYWQPDHPVGQLELPIDELPDIEDMPVSRIPEFASQALGKTYHELCEIDTRFGQLGENGLFATLDRAKVLAHHFDGVDNIEQALSNPPTLGRARLRGLNVRRFSRQKSRYFCDWSYVADRENRRYVDLSDPFAKDNKWQPMSESFLRESPSLQDQMGELINQVSGLHEGGSHEAAYRLLRGIEMRQNALTAGLRIDYLRLHAWIQSRRGFLDDIEALDEVAQMYPMNLSLINSYVCAYRYHGMRPPAAIDPWIERGRALLAGHYDRPDSAVLPFLGHTGYCLLRHGRAEDALRTLQEACEPDHQEWAIPGAVARALADLGDAHRVFGHLSEATECIDQAEQLQTQHQFTGDRADFALTYRAKLEPNRQKALALLSQAKNIQTEQCNVMGETRTLLLEARLQMNPAATEQSKIRLLALRDLRPALAQCGLFAKILDHWQAWTSGAADPDGGTDFFWWL